MVPAIRPIIHSFSQTTLGRMASINAETQFNKVVFFSGSGWKYGENQKYIANALNRLFPGEFDLVFICESDTSSFPPFVRCVRKDSYQSLRELATARIWIDSARNMRWVRKRDDQYYFQVWHSSIGPKRVEGMVEDELPSSYIKLCKFDGSITDLMISNNDFESKLRKTYFWYTGPILRCGTPRNRPLIDPEPNTLNEVRSSLGIPLDKKLCLYAPTFRKDLDPERFILNLTLVKEALEKRWEEQYIVGYRLHPNMAHKTRPTSLAGYLDLTLFPDPQELLAISDVLISDYSSILEDFIFTGRPAFSFLPDYESYLDERGFVYPLSSRPFPLAYTEGDLLREITLFDSNNYQQRCSQFFQDAGVFDDGQGDEVLAQLIMALSNKEAILSDVLSSMHVPLDY